MHGRNPRAGERDMMWVLQRSAERYLVKVTTSWCKGKEAFEIDTSWYQPGDDPQVAVAVCKVKLTS